MENTSIDDFEKLAIRLKKNLAELKRPVIVEFSGTPKSGKTTCLEAISKYLRRNEISTIVIPEQSVYCPISDKLDLRFNIWTGTQSLNQLLESIEKRPSVIILDRGIFDTLVWLKLLYKKDEITEMEYETVKKFFLLEKWTSTINLVVVIKADSEAALQREFKDSITLLTGRIMNKPTLDEYNNCLEEAAKEYEKSFNQIMELNTTTIKTEEGVALIANKVITVIDQMADEPVGLIDKSVIKNYFGDNRVISTTKEIGIITNEIFKNINWARRTEAEGDVNKVQIVSVAVFRLDDKIAVFAVRGNKQGQILQNKTSIWVGGHVRTTDRPSGGRRNTILRRALCREIEEELKYKVHLNDIPIQPKAIIWDTTKPKSIQHLAVFYEIRLSETKLTEKFNSREYWEDLEKSLFTQVIELNESLLTLPNWENWSLLYLKHVEGLNIQLGDFQTLIY